MFLLHTLYRAFQEAFELLSSALGKKKKKNNTSAPSECWCMEQGGRAYLMPSGEKAHAVSFTPSFLQLLTYSS